MKTISPLALFFVSLVAVAQATMDPAPGGAGEEKSVSTKIIRDAEHPCGKVVTATRNNDGTISAKCSNKEKYRIFTANNKPIAMRCSVASKLGVSGC